MKFNYLASLLFAALLIAACGEDEKDPVTVTLADFTATVSENIQNDDVIGIMNGTTSDGTLTYTITDEDPVGALSINNNGQLRVADASLFSFADRQSVTATVEARNGDVSQSASVNITIEEFSDMIVFTKADGADETREENQDRITDNVWITRAVADGQIYNAVSESEADKDASPIGTEWAIGTTDDVASLTFAPFREAVGEPKNTPGKNLVLHLIADDIYLDVKFTSWSVGKNKGGFSYERSIPQ